MNDSQIFTFTILPSIGGILVMMLGLIMSDTIISVIGLIMTVIPPIPISIMLGNMKENTMTKYSKGDLK